MGRKPFDFSKYVDTENKNQRKCRLCGHRFVGNGTRVRAHLHGIPGKGVEVCSKSKQFLQEYYGSNEGIKATDNKRERGSTNEASLSNSIKRAKTIATEQGLQDLGFPNNHNTLNEDKVDNEAVKGLPCQLVSQKKEKKEKELLPINKAEKLHCKVGPFSISHPVEADDQKLKNYEFPSNPRCEVNTDSPILDSPSNWNILDEYMEVLDSPSNWNILDENMEVLDSPSTWNILVENMDVDIKIEDLACQAISLKKENKEEEVVEFTNNTYQVGPFSISHPVEEDDLKLIQYVFNSNGDPREEVVRFSNWHLDRSEFTTLRPGGFLDELVINIFVEKLTKIERKEKNRCMNWYLPVSFSGYALCGEKSLVEFVEQQKIRETYMSNLAECNKIFIPIHIGQQTHGHFYLYVVHVKKNVVEIWDSLPNLSSIDTMERAKKAKHMLLILDTLFLNDIRNIYPEGLTFAKFDIAMANDIPSQPNGYDCGIFVIKFMKSAVDMTNLNTEFQSDEERLSLALSFLKDDMNRKKERLFQEAKKLYQQDYEDQQHLDNCHSNALPSIRKEPELQGIGDLNCSSKNRELPNSNENYTMKRSEKAGLDQKIHSTVENEFKYVEQRNNQIHGMEEEANRMVEKVTELSWNKIYRQVTPNDPKFCADPRETEKQTFDEVREFLESSEIGNHESSIDPSKREELKSIDANLDWEQYFIHCAFYPENRKISREELIRYFVDEGLINGMMSLEAQFDEGHTIVHALEKQGLLEGGSFNMEEQDRDDELDQDQDYIWLKGGIVDPVVKWVKISDDSRAKAISMMNENSGFMVEVGLGLTEIPYERKWSSMQKVSLMCNSIKKIPRGNSLKCPELSTLILQRNPLKEISDNFFSDMPALKVLDLSYTNIQKLPNSISNLKSLNSLLLKSCRRLQIVPPLGKLKRLRRLDLSHTAITKLPEGLEKLVHLTWLSFFKCEKLDMKPNRLIPKLTYLQYLVLDLNRYRFMKVSAKDLADLKKLETFAGNLCSTSDFNTYVQSIQDKDCKPKNYLLQLGSGNPWDPTFGKAVIFINCDILTGKQTLQLPVDVEQLYIAQCMRWRCVCDDLSSNITTSLKYIDIFECDGLENFCCSHNSCTFCSSLQSLQSLHLACLQNLRFLWREIDPPFFTLPCLRRLKVAECDSIRKLFTYQMLEKLPNLEKILVRDCEAMEEIFSVTGREEMGEPSSGGNSQRPKLFFPKLVSLELLNLPLLTSVCGVTMKFECLQEFTIGGCPQLIRLPDTEPLVDIKYDP